MVPIGGHPFCFVGVQEARVDLQLKILAHGHFSNVESSLSLFEFEFVRVRIEFVFAKARKFVRV